MFKGGFNGWFPAYSCKDFKDGVLEIKGLVNETGGENFYCGIFEDVETPTYMYRNATIECKNETGDYGDAVEFLEDDGKNSVSNAHITGLAPNAKFDIKITTEDGKVYVAVKVTEAGAEDTRTFAKIIEDDYYIKDGGVYYREITVKYLTGNNAYAQFVKDEGGNSKVDLGSGFPANMSNFYIVVKADSSSSKVWARIEPTNDAIVF